MAKRLRASRLWLCAGLWLAAAGAPPTPGAIARAESGRARESADPPVKERALSDQFSSKLAPRPAYSIPVEPLGFGQPNAVYLGMRIAQVSLDFMGEDRLLFTFKVPSLLRRDAASSEERRIRAVVLGLPSGTVEAAAAWTVHDYNRYLWMLHNGHFLLRNEDNLLEGGTSLALKPFLQFPGPLLWLELDPTQQFMVTDSREPVAEAHKAGAAAGSSKAAGSAGTTDASAPPQYVLRVMHRNPSQIILVSRIRSLIHLPINSTGYVEELRGSDSEWTLNFNNFTGGSRVIGEVQSACAPGENFVSTGEMLVTACSDTGGDRLMAMTTGGRILWEYLTPAADIWPQLALAANGLRIARETLVTDSGTGPFNPPGSESVRGQLVRVFDAANGDLVLQLPIKSALDGGGNVAISPSGRRVAVLNGGAIEVYELPAPPPLPAPPAFVNGQPAH